MRGSEADQGSGTVRTIDTTVLNEAGFACTKIPITRLLSIREVYTHAHNHFIHNNNEVLL